MPYFIYRIHPGKRLEHLEEYDVFKEAKNAARDMRKNMSESDDFTVKIIFAEDTNEAEHELSQEREAPILMEHEK